MLNDTSATAIFKLNKFYIKKILFKAEGFSYIFKRAAIKFWVIFFLEMLNATIYARDNRIAPKAFWSRISHLPSDVSFDF